MSGIHIPGLSTLLPTAGNNNAQPTSVTDEQATTGNDNAQLTSLTNEQATTKESQPATIGSANAQPTETEPSTDEIMVDHPPSPPSLTSGLEALLGGLDPLPEQAAISSDPSNHTVDAPSEPNAAAPSESNDAVQNEEPLEPTVENMEGEHPEWEEDSSPYESSSDSSSSDSDDDSDDEKDYKILGPEETARILMEMDGGSDDEGEGKGKGSGSGLVRTKNELKEEIIPRPEVEIKPDMQLVELGTIEHFVGNTAVIKANTTGEYQILDIGSVLCLQDRTVIAALADVIASVREPRYTAGFTSEEEIKSFGLDLGTKIFYPPAFANLGMTQAIRNIKGTDASNWHDEEVGDEEIEFSDDEKEAEYKRQLKAKKRGTRGGRDGAASRGGRNDAAAGASAASTELTYDDDDDDGPYRPLARPAGYGKGQPSFGSNEPSSGFSGRGGAYRGNRSDPRGRAGRGRGGRGNRGGNSRGGHSLPPRPQDQGGQGLQSFQQPPIQQYSLPPAPPTLQMGGQSYPVFPPQPNSQQPHQPPNQQLAFPWPQNTTQGFYPPPPPQFTGQQGMNGMHFNPSFFAALQNQVQAHAQHQAQNQAQNPAQNQAQSQHGQQNNQWTGQQGQHNNQWTGQGGQG